MQIVKMNIILLASIVSLAVFSVSSNPDDCKNVKTSFSQYCHRYKENCTAVDKSDLPRNNSRNDASDYFISPSHSDCMMEIPANCDNLKFDGGSTTELGLVALKVYSLSHCIFHYPVLNLTLTHIKWTTLVFRYMQQNDSSRTFCGKFILSQNCKISELGLFYDRRWIWHNDTGKNFIFEYQAERGSYKEAKKYYFHLSNFGLSYHVGQCELKDWVPLLYIDVSKWPVLTARWQQVPHLLGSLKYELKVFDKEELKKSEVIEGTDEELSYTFTPEFFPTYGEYKFGVRILNDCCENGPCPVSESPVIKVGDSNKIIFGIIFGGITILILLLLLTGYVWKKKNSTKLSYENQRPEVLIIYIPSNALHVKAVKEFAQYLRNYCYVKALLDQLDIPDTETKDPFEWYNDNFNDPDFIMVVSSPPVCCHQEGIYRNVDVLALNLFKAKFSSRGARSQFFAVLLPYCTKQNIPHEARNIRRFKLIKDLDKMLWFIHNGGKVPTFLDSLCALFGPEPFGGKVDLKAKGIALLTALKEAENVPPVLCKCEDVKEKNNGFYRRLVRQFSADIIPKRENNFEISSTKPVDSELVDMYFEDPVLDEMNLSGEEELIQKTSRKSKEAEFGIDLDNLIL